jgi:hypothetical protein
VILQVAVEACPAYLRKPFTFGCDRHPRLNLHGAGLDGLVCSGKLNDTKAAVAGCLGSGILAEVGDIDIMAFCCLDDRLAWPRIDGLSVDREQNSRQPEIVARGFNYRSDRVKHSYCPFKFIGGVPVFKNRSGETPPCAPMGEVDGSLPD